MSRPFVDGRLVGDWHRHHPEAQRIAAAVPAPMLALSTGMLVSDIRARFGCCERTAAQAVSFARQAKG